jgi:alanine racemase
VSYGGTWSAPRKSRVAVVPIGYADGYHRILSNKSRVLVKGKLVPIVGNVCMDYIMLDVTDVVTDNEFHHNISLQVTLFGYDESNNLIPVQEVASLASTIPWEILTSIGERVPRILDHDSYVAKKSSREALK